VFPYYTSREDVEIGGIPVFMTRTVTRVSDVGRALVRGARGWPGVDACVLAYVATVAALYQHPEVQLLGLLAAMAVGIAWYASPARAWEEARRQRRRGPGR
jgi:hypothetical protein